MTGSPLPANIPEELLQQYEKRIRRGEPAGELREELISGGLSHDDAEAVLNTIAKRQAHRSEWRDSFLPYVVAGLFILTGAVLLRRNMTVGMTLILTGLGRIGWSFFGPKNKGRLDRW